MIRRALLLLALLATAAGGLHAQPTSPVRGYAGFDVLVANPTGAFAENVGTGFGIAGHGSLLFDGGPLALRADLGFVNYGNETIRICVTQPCRVTGDLTTSNNIFFLGMGPELILGGSGAHVYGNASIGFAFFNTTSSVSGSGNQGDPFAQSSNHDDLTFAWLAGAGTRFRIAGTATPVYLDLGARYHGNGEAEYLRKGDIHDRPDGGVDIYPQRSDTNLWTFRIGVSVGLRDGWFAANR